MATWGTAYQNFQSQNEDEDNDAITSISNVNSSMISQNLKKLERAVLEQIKQRALLESEILDLVDRERTKAKEKQEFLESNKAKKMQIIQQRDCLPSAVNYMYHPQIEDL